MRHVSARILPLATLTEDDKHSFGSDVLELAILKNEGLPVPTGFAIPLEFYQEFLSMPGLQKRIDQLLSTIHFERSDSLMQVANHILHDLTRVPLPMTNEIEDIYYSLFDTQEITARITVHPVIGTGQSLPLPIRPIHTILTPHSLKKEIHRAYGSLFHAASLRYHHEHKLPLFSSYLVVLIEHILPSEKSGIIHLTHPLLHQKDKIVIKSVHGDIETLHGKHAIPEYMELHKKTGIVTKHQHGLQKVIHVRNGYDLTMHAQAVNGVVLYDHEREALIDIALTLNKLLMVPKDIVFSIHNGEIVLTDIKPHTTIHQSNNQESNHRTFLTGTPYAPGIYTGFPAIIHTPKDLRQVRTGDIVIVKNFSIDLLSIAHKAKGIVSEQALSHGHVAASLKRQGIPIIGNVLYATQKISPHTAITINGSQGTIQHVKKHTVSRHYNQEFNEKKHEVIPHYQVCETLMDEMHPNGSEGMVIVVNNRHSHEQLTQIINHKKMYSQVKTIIFDLSNYQGPLAITPLLEIRTLQHAFSELTIGILLPTVHSLHELASYKKYLTEAGLHRSPLFHVYIRLVTLLQSVQLHELLHGGIDGVVVFPDLLKNDMTQVNDTQRITLVNTLVEQITNRHLLYFLVDTPDEALTTNKQITAILDYKREATKK